MSSRLDHIVIGVKKDQFEAIVKWYLAAMGPLGYEKMFDFGETVGLGSKPKADFWITCNETHPPTGYLHLGFRAYGRYHLFLDPCYNLDNLDELVKTFSMTRETDHATVEAFHAAAVKAGGKSNGEPGIRAMYHPNYYGAFVLDPVGNNIEVVDHSPN